MVGMILPEERDRVHTDHWIDQKKRETVRVCKFEQFSDARIKLLYSFLPLLTKLFSNYQSSDWLWMQPAKRPGPRHLLCLWCDRREAKLLVT